MTGKIIRGIAGFYYVLCQNQNLYECKAKGSFRKEDRKPLVGDDVEITVLDEKNQLGNIIEILPRMNELIRPAVANVDGALVVFAMKSPEPNYNLLDRFLIMMEQHSLPCILCFNKQDIVTQEEKDRIRGIYEETGYTILFVSALENSGIDSLKEKLMGQTWAIAGPSGVGKSSIINRLQTNTTMETGEISRKTERGKQTTRHTELIQIEPDTYIMDTPGFSSLSVFDMEKEDLRFFYPEYGDYEGTCKYIGCTHIHEPGCMVLDAVKNHKLSQTRYDNYAGIFEELKQKRRY